jgi:hypothetical protein
MPYDDSITETGLVGMERLLLDVNNLPSRHSDLLKSIGAKTEDLPELDAELLFVVGCPRSGTTLLGNMLGSHRSATVGDESMFLLSLWHDYSKLVLGLDRRGAKFLRSYVSPEEALVNMRYYAARYFNGLIRKSIGKTPVVAIDHTPWYGLMIPFIRLLFPQSNWIYLERNLDEVSESLRLVRETGAIWGQDSHLGRQRLWELFRNECAEAATEHSFVLHQVTYRDIVDHPEETLTPVLTSLGLPWEPSVASALMTEWAPA